MHLTVVPKIVRLFLPRGLTWQIKKSTQTETVQVNALGDKADKESKASPTIYLTFDDGPVPEITPAVLEILRQYNAKATFFCVGDNVRKHRGVYEMVLREGHATGIHTFSHLKGIKTDDVTYFSDIEKCAEYVDTKLFRPPYGRISRSQVKYLRTRYRIIMWSALTGDYNHRLTKEQVLENAIKHTKDGSIIVFHDSIKASERMFYALPRMLEHFTKMGYKFEAID